MSAPRTSLAVCGIVLAMVGARAAHGGDRPDAAVAATALERAAKSPDAARRLAAFQDASAAFNSIHAQSTEDGGQRVIEIVKARWVPVLLAGCDDAEPRVREEAARALRIYARWGADAIAPRLVTLVDRSADPAVRAAAADVLGAAGPLDAEAHRVLLRRLLETTSSDDDRADFAVALAVSGARGLVIEALRRAIERGDAAGAEACLDGLTPGRRPLPSSDVVAVAELVAVAAGRVRHHLVVVVARGDVPTLTDDRVRVAVRMAEALTVETSGTRYWAAIALARLGSDARGQVAALERALREPSEERTRAALASAIVGVATADGAAGPLSPFLDDPSRQVRSVVAWALGEVTKDRAAARARLERRLPRETDPEVLADLRAALARLAEVPK